MIGRYAIGEEVSLTLNTTNGSGTPTAPTSAPTARLYRGTTLIATKKMPRIDIDVTGLFALPLYLTNDYSTTGIYQVVYVYVISGTTYQAQDTFEVVAGGHHRGSVMAMYRLTNPEAVELVQYTSGGVLQSGRNPR